MTTSPSIKTIEEVADLLIAAKQLTDRVDDTELNRVLTEALIRVGRLLARQLKSDSLTEE